MSKAFSCDACGKTMSGEANHVVGNVIIDCPELEGGILPIQLEIYVPLAKTDFCEGCKLSLAKKAIEKLMPNAGGIV